MSDEDYRSFDWAPGYRVSRFGVVESQHWRKGVTGAWKVLKVKPQRGGYLAVNLYIDGKCSTQKIHQLVLLAFVGSCPEGMECCHKDGNPANNELSNLRWDTKKANAADWAELGGVRRRTAFQRGPFTAVERALIRSRREKGRTKTELAKEFGCSWGGIHWICSDKSLEKKAPRLSWMDTWLMQVRRTDGLTFAQIAEEFKVSRSYARKICGWIAAPK